MADQLTLLDPKRLQPNPENPRMIFREGDLKALEESITNQGILVPLTVYKDGRQYFILDGERRWRCAVKLALGKVPIIVQPKPDRLLNIMMMFAIHNARTDWDPLPTALKLEELEKHFKKTQGRTPKEAELAELASMSRGEVRRLRKLLGLPKKYRRMLLKELEKPKPEQTISVDQVLEATTGAQALRKREVVSTEEEVELRDAIIEKFKTGVIDNTVAPRKLARLARAVERDELPVRRAKSVVNKLISQSQYSIDRAYKDSVERIEFEHVVIQLSDRLQIKLAELIDSDEELNEKTAASLRALRRSISKLL